MKVNRNEVWNFPTLAAAIDRAEEVKRCLWVQVAGRTASLYKVYPGGRCIHYNAKEVLKKVIPSGPTVQDELVNWCNQQDTAFAPFTLIEKPS